MKMIEGLAVTLMVMALGCASAATDGTDTTAARTATGLGAEREAAGALAPAAWIAGCWEASSSGGSRVTEEQWTAPRGGLMLGVGRSIRDGTARGYEYLHIRAENDRLVYHAEPSGQTPTDFVSRDVESGRLDFANPDHDFPQRIVYVRRSADSLRVAVYGNVADSSPAFQLAFARVRCAGP